jgi:Domain of unknown function (DUF4124)
MASDMTAKPMHGRSTLAAALIAAGALVLAASVADAATASIYKCPGANLVVIYTDQPCKGGEQLDIRAGDADAAAVAQLQRVRDQLDWSAAVRIGEERRTAAQRDLAALARRERDEDRSAAYEPDDSVSPYGDALPWYPAFVAMHSAHPRRPHPPRTAAPRSFAPNPPYHVPRS